jgi:hypothetical protein
MEVSGQHHAPVAVATGNDSGTRWIGGRVGPRGGLDVLGISRSEESSPVTIPTELSRLGINEAGNVLSTRKIKITKYKLK